MKRRFKISKLSRKKYLVIFLAVQFLLNTISVFSAPKIENSDNCKIEVKKCMMAEENSCNCCEAETVVTHSMHENCNCGCSLQSNIPSEDKKEKGIVEVNVNKTFNLFFHVIILNEEENTGKRYEISRNDSYFHSTSIFIKNSTFLI